MTELIARIKALLRRPGGVLGITLPSQPCAKPTSSRPPQWRIVVRPDRKAPYKSATTRAIGAVEPLSDELLEGGDRPWR
jgi:hypothetical protein